MVNQKIEEFVTCIDESRFYDAHEALEELWFPKRFEKDLETDLLKGFINAAVSFELIKRGRVKQSHKVWANYLKYRQNLYKVSSEYKNSYFKLARYIEQKHHTLIREGNF